MMGWVSGLVAYLILWWLVLFVVLPFGVITQGESGEGVEPGTPESAPARSRIGLKLAITTSMTFIPWGILYIIVKYELISIR